ncbi:MAG: ABC transporter ATP-binding protein, partial [Myxococcota bacterium]
LLSTHIVEDVESLCEQLTIMDAGKSIAQGSVEELTRALDGTLWSTLMGRGEPLGAHLHATATPKGKLVVRFADARPGEQWQPHTPRLEDVYHHALSKEVA